MRSAYDHKEDTDERRGTFRWEKKHSSVSSIIVPFDFNGVDCFAIVALIFIGTFCRFWRIHQPRGFLLSEVDALSAMHNYNSRTFFYESNPPLGRILFYQLSKKVSYDFKYNLNAQSGYVYPSVQYISMRSITAMFSILVLPFSYLTLRLFGCRQFVSCVCGLFCFMEPSLISTGRMICDGGFIQFFGCLSLGCAALSSHYLFNSAEQITWIVLQGLFSGIALSISYNSLIYVVFALAWPYIKFNSKKQMIMNSLIVFAVLYISILMHIFMTPNNTKNGILFNCLLNMSTNNSQLGIKHILLAFNYLVRQLFDFVIKSISSLKLKSILKRLFMMEKYTLLYLDNAQQAYCFVNKFASIPSLILSYYGIMHGISMKIYDLKFIISCLFILSTILNSISYHQYGCIDTHISAYIGILSLGLNADHSLSKSVLSSTLTLLTIISSIWFIKLSTIIFSYPSK